MRRCEFAHRWAGVLVGVGLCWMVPVQAAPSKALRQVCAAGDLDAAQAQASVRNTPLPDARIWTVVADETGHTQRSYFVLGGVPVGVQQQAGRNIGLLYGRHDVAFERAQVLVADAPLPQDVNELLADWRLLAQGAARYLCLSDSLGMRSGRSQYVRYVYLWDLNHPERLYYDVVNVWPLVPGHDDATTP